MMVKVNEQRVAANIEGDFVVFLIGMRINKPWKLHKWLPVFFGHVKDAEGVGHVAFRRNRISWP